IGAAKKASVVSRRKPYFLYCNPDDVLMPILRSKEVIENPEIHKINLAVGPMAISGSTRMQASTVLMLGIGVGLLYSHDSQERFQSFYQDFLRRLTLFDYSLLAPLTLKEASLYQEKKFLNYISHPDLAISILTDTTERSPTFSLKGFENDLDGEGTCALSYLFIPQTSTSEEAWSKLLARKPRPLEWGDLPVKINRERVFGFDISEAGLKKREQRVESLPFYVRYEDGQVTLECEGEKVIFRLGNDNLFNHLMVKMMLNAHST